VHPASLPRQSSTRWTRLHGLRPRGHAPRQWNSEGKITSLATSGDDVIQG
jgi:hypothetical protein